MACNIKDPGLHDASHQVDDFCNDVMESINSNFDAFCKIGSDAEIDAIANLLEAVHKKSTEAHNASIVGRH